MDGLIALSVITNKRVEADVQILQEVSQSSHEGPIIVHVFHILKPI